MSAELLFVSRSGHDAVLGEKVARILEGAGHRVILQQWSFANKSFIGEMQAALEGGARVVALLSDSYLKSDYCAAEWQSVLADDPLNKRSGLIVLRVGECSPPGLLKALAYWDLVAVDDDGEFERIVVGAIRSRTEPGARSVPVPAASARKDDAHNLPAQLTVFVGRGTVKDEIKAQIEQARLVTLLGAGGIGKTRTALAVAAELLDGSGDGVWFVDFAPLGAATYVTAEIASVFGIREEHGKPLLESVVVHLKEKRLLLILDNCEHVIDEARKVAEVILRGCPQVRILATSREPLAAQGEAIYKFPTLGVPARSERLSADEAFEYEAVALFVSRARAAEPRFVLTDDNAAVVADICRRLDGIALAIELAAPRLKILSLAQLAQKLDERFRLLTGGSKTALPRQQTMRALIDWSYNLLDRFERQLLRRLSIFSGGWTLEAATAVAGDDDDDEFVILDGLTSLADKSLVAVDFTNDEQRFRFLESMRAYAQEASRAGDDQAALARRHANYFTDFIGDGSTLVLADSARLAKVEVELENFRDVMTWALDRGNDADLGGRIACALGRFWSIRHPGEGLRWLAAAQRALAGNGDLELVAKLATAVAAMLPHGSFERFEATERALDACRTAGSGQLLTRALSAYGEQLAPVERAEEARAAFAEALQLARAFGTDWDAARALAGIGSTAIDGGDIVTARTVLNEALALFEKLSSIDGVAYVCIALGQTEFIDGNVKLALDLTLRARIAHGRLGNNWSSACAANYLAAFSLAQDDLANARTHARDALDLLRLERHPLFFAEAVSMLGFVATLSGDPERGALLFGYAQSAYGNFAHKRSQTLQVCHDRHVRLLTEALGERRRTELEARGYGLDDARVLAEALAV